MAEIFGAVAAGIGVGSELIRLGRAIQKRIKRIKDSRKDIEELATETIIFAGLYKRFLHACNDDPDAYTTDASAIRPLVSWARKTVESLTNLLLKVESLCPQSKPRFELEDKFIAHLVWYGSTSNVKALRASLSVARESINGFSNLMCLRKLKEQVNRLREALTSPRERRKLEKKLGVTLETRIREIDRDIDDSQAVHDENKKMLSQAERKVTKYQGLSQTSDNVPAPHELFQFTQTLDDYARELFPSRQARQRAYSSSSESSVPRSESTNSSVSQPSQSASRTRPGLRSVNRENTAVFSNDTSPTSNSVSGRSFRPSTATPSSLSGVSSASDSRPDVRLPLNNQAGATIERRGTRAREYVNDPKGDILSPPILKINTQPTKKMVLGRHTITLTATRLFVNSNQLHIVSQHDYSIADIFFTALKEHAVHLDELDQVLLDRHNRGPEWRWTRIPGWVVTSHTVNMLPVTLGIQTIHEAGSFGTLRKPFWRPP